jgi:hypothetical protein
MELNVCQRREPSHIHIRRPSRDQALPAAEAAGGLRAPLPAAESEREALTGWSDTQPV